MSQLLLFVSGLMMCFGGLLVVNNVLLEFRECEIVLLIGFNGVGKIIVFNCLIGFYKFIGGIILLCDQYLEGLLGQQIVWMGVVWIFQYVCLFCEMMVIENLLVVQYQQLKIGFFFGLLKMLVFCWVQSEVLDRVVIWLECIGLLEYVNCQVSNLVYGDQCWLEIVCCMVIQLEILMFDELVVGLNLKEIKELDEFIVELCNYYNIIILFIEYDMKLVMGIFDCIYVVNQGILLVNGMLEEICNNLDVICVYFGEV